MFRLKTIDTKLMNWLTLNWRYSDWSKAPKSFALKIAIFNFALALIAVWFAFGNSVINSAFLIFFALFMGLCSLYHFRVWYKYKN